MLSTAIILAGGSDTYPQQVVSDVPKPMELINGKPFLYWLLQYCSRQGIDEVVLSIGYKGEVIENYFGSSFQNISIKYCREEVALGTGGAIKAALAHTNARVVFVLNGDTFFSIDLNKFFNFHLEEGGISVALKEMQNFDRYGAVNIDEANRIISFDEKKWVDKGYINGGIYIIGRGLFSDRTFPFNFSFEKDILQKNLDGKHIFGFPFTNNFIDIGVSEDYLHAQIELESITSGNNPQNWPIDKSWTVFLDRDGVINKKIDNDYVCSLAMFEWLPGAIDSIKQLSAVFGRVIIVTNQQGIGKKLMTEQDVNIVHDFILKEVSAAGGRIDRIYFSPYLKADNHPTRKPGIGMALEAKKDFPEIDFTKSVIIGDSLSDMQFGEAAGMKKVYVQHKPSIQLSIPVDAIVTSIQEVLMLFSNNQ